MAGYVQPQSDKLVSSIHSWVVCTADTVVLIDTCVGNHKPRGFAEFDRLGQPYLERLAAAGYGPADVDLVMCTHLHADHVGWNTRLEDGRCVPTFPNARYLVSQVEHRHHAALAQRPDAVQAHISSYNDSVLPIVEAGLLDYVEDDHAICAGLTVRWAPGHTPGHMTVDLASRGKRALFSGDALHFPVQIPHWQWRMRIDDDPVQACLTRRAVLEHCAEHGALLLPAHFLEPHGGYVCERGGNFTP